MHKGSNGWQGARAVGCLPALTGNVGIPGGGFGPRHGGARATARSSTTSPSWIAGPPGRYVPNQMPRVTEALEDGRLRALLLFGTDMLSSYADAGRLAEGLGRTDLVVSHDLFLNDTARRFADVVLPSTSWLEELGLQEHQYPSLPDGAGAAAGRGDRARWPKCCGGWPGASTWTASIPGRTRRACSTRSSTIPRPGDATVAAMRAEGGIRALRVSHVAHPDLVFPTPSGKVELVSERAASLGLPALPVYEPLPDSPYPLTFRQGRTLTQFHGFYDHGRALPTLARLDPEPVLWISPDDAAARALDGRRAHPDLQRAGRVQRPRADHGSGAAGHGLDAGRLDGAQPSHRRRGRHSRHRGGFIRIFRRSGFLRRPGRGRTRLNPQC